MTARAPELSIDLPCHVCGYDLRAHPIDGVCPECNASVAESARLAKIPRRPAWRDSDPRWRRRVLIGVWILVLVPLLAAMREFEWTQRVPVPNVFGLPGTVRTVEETFLTQFNAYPTLVFCVGVVLLFSKERGRRRERYDWTRRWGVLMSYVTLVLSAAPLVFISALVVTGIGAVFLSMPVKHQPEMTDLFAAVGSNLLRYGPHPKELAHLLVVASSSLAVLLACLPLFDALRSTGPTRTAAILVAPLALFALMHLAQLGRYLAGFSNVTARDLDRYAVYFSPALLTGPLPNLSTGLTLSGESLENFAVEAAKWCIVFAIALWLTIAWLAPSIRPRRRTDHAGETAPAPCR